MSTDGAVKSASLKVLLRQISEDQTSTRRLRFAVGVTLAVALAYAINWPLSFLFPILTSVLLALPFPMPSVQAGMRNMLYTLGAFAMGLVFSLFFLNYPLAYIPALGLVLFHLYYYLNRGGSFWLTLIGIMAILLLPMLANTSEGLAFGVSVGFIVSSWSTVIMVWVSHLLVPDPQAGKFPQLPGFQPGYSYVAAQKALKSTLVVLPLASLFIIFNLTDYLMVLLFSAIFIFKPELSEGREAGRNSLISTILGGLGAWVFYLLIVAVPEFHFFIALMFLTSLIFAMQIFSIKPSAKYYGSAFVALLILVNGSMAEGADFIELFAMRIILILVTVMYIVAALKLLNSYWPAKAEV